MPLLNPSEYSAEALMADVALRRSRRNQLEIQLLVLQEGLLVEDNPIVRKKPLGTYAVGQFETLPMVSSAVYGVPDHWAAIAAENGLEYPYTIVPGQVLKLPEVSRS